MPKVHVRTIPFYEVQYQAASMLFRKPWKHIPYGIAHKSETAAEEVARIRSKKFPGMTYRVCLVVGEIETTRSTWYGGTREDDFRKGEGPNAAAEATK